MRGLCIQAMEFLTENMTVDELGAEIRRLTPLIRGLVNEPTDEELRASVRNRVETEWETLSELASSYTEGDVVPRKVSRFVRNLYTNWAWPSPLPRLMVLELGMTTNKRIKHVQAIRLLAQRLGCSFLDFVSKEREEVAAILFPRSLHQNPVAKLLYR
jgi:hypothetical protein